MAQTLASLREAVLRRLGDAGGAIWPTTDVDQDLQDAYRELAQRLHVFWDWLYLENLSGHFSYTADWEGSSLLFDFGLANYTLADELRTLAEAERIGPAWVTSPADLAWVSDLRANPAIPATADVPTTLTELSRATWDRSAIDASTSGRMAEMDARYETTQGEVYALLWQQDGIRTVRKVRVPAAVADQWTVNGSWGLLRRPADISAETVSGTWGICRRVPGEHPMGPERFGAPRRFVRDGKNVRVEHWRLGRAMVNPGDVCELPDRYALYLRDYAQARCLARAGPGQDLALSAHYDQRWQRGLTRIQRRTTQMQAQRVGVIGGGRVSVVQRPPRPSLPWQYGARVR